MKFLRNLGTIGTVLTASVAVVFLSAASAQAHHRDSGAPQKKLIVFTSPSPTQLTYAALQNAGKTFDGFVVQHVKGSHDDEAHDGSNFAWCAFSDRRYTLDPNDTSGDYIGDSLDALKQLPKDVMPDRFLRINLAPYGTPSLNWRDDRFWDNVVNNMKVASRFASEAGLKGFFIDTEQYNSKLLTVANIRQSPGYDGASFDDLSAVAERRGRQVIEALNSQMPDCRIFVSFGYITVSQHVARADLKKFGTLLVPFLDGMLDGSTPTTSFTDAFEASYWHDDSPNYFTSWVGHVKDGDQYNMRFQKYPEKYRSQYHLAFGIFLDRDHDTANKRYGWCGDGKPIFYSPRRLAFTVQQACTAADEYVWIYTDKPNPWIAPKAGAPNDFPTVISDAIRDGQHHANDPSLPRLTPNTDTATDSQICSGN